MSESEFNIRRCCIQLFVLCICMCVRVLLFLSIFLYQGFFYVSVHVSAHYEAEPGVCKAYRQTYTNPNTHTHIYMYIQTAFLRNTCCGQLSFNQIFRALTLFARRLHKKPSPSTAGRCRLRQFNSHWQCSSASSNISSIIVYN